MLTLPLNHNYIKMKEQLVFIARIGFEVIAGLLELHTGIGHQAALLCIVRQNHQAVFWCFYKLTTTCIWKWRIAYYLYSKSSKIKVQKGILLFKQTGIVRYYSFFSLIIYQGLTLKYENYNILFIKTPECKGGENSLILVVGPILVLLSHVYVSNPSFKL